LYPSCLTQVNRPRCWSQERFFVFSSPSNSFTWFSKKMHSEKSSAHTFFQLSDPPACFLESFSRVSSCKYNQYECISLCSPFSQREAWSMYCLSLIFLLLLSHDLGKISTSYS
jgi:hypothetical protein